MRTNSRCASNCSATRSSGSASSTPCAASASTTSTRSRSTRPPTTSRRSSSHRAIRTIRTNPAPPHHPADRGWLLEAQRLEGRTMFDLERSRRPAAARHRELSRHLSGRETGEPPPTLLSSSRATSCSSQTSPTSHPKVGGMFKGDRARKESLVRHGFRLPSALDNRPLSSMSSRSTSTRPSTSLQPPRSTSCRPRRASSWSRSSVPRDCSIRPWRSGPPRHRSTTSSARSARPPRPGDASS